MAAQQACPHRLCRSSADYRSFSLPPSFSSFCCVLPRFFSSPRALSSPSIFTPITSSILLVSSSFTPLNAPSGGFGYTGMQSSSQSHFSYGLSQGPRARTQSSEVSDALYSLDRVLQGKCAAYEHGSTGRPFRVRCIKHRSSASAALLNVPRSEICSSNNLCFILETFSIHICISYYYYMW